MKTTRIPKCACPHCGQEICAATLAAGEFGRNDGRPEPGNLTICIQCAELNVFTDQLGLRTMTAKEKGELSVGTQREIERIRHCLNQVKHQMN